MLTEIHIRNFKCFSDHTIPLRPVSIIVGKNNAGKTTIIEALRLISIVTSRFQDLAFHDSPTWLRDELSRYVRGVSPSLKGMEFNFENVFHRYGNPPSVITAQFSDATVVKTYIGPENEIFATLTRRDGTKISTKGEAKQSLIPSVNILPQVAPLERHEKLLGREYVRSALSSSLAPRHFRNQLELLNSSYSDFRKLAEDTWTGLALGAFNGGKGVIGAEISLHVRDNDFVAEIGTMGHGLQMWLQTMWFLARTEKKSTVILDEPDVYMHPDLQRRLIRLLSERYSQVIVATHSIEILSEVDADQILVIEKQKSASVFADTLPAVQRLIYRIGGIHNIQLTRLFNSRCCLLVEGKDRDILRHVQNTLFPNSNQPIGVLPHVVLGGWSGWNYGIGSSMLIKNSFGEKVTVYCLFDRDYHTDEEIKARCEDAKKRGVQLHIWKRKEIENYFLVPSVIQRLISSRITKNVVAPTTELIIDQIEQFVLTHKDEVTDSLANELYVNDKASGLVIANKKARQRIDECWPVQDKRWNLVSGKVIISQLSGWSQNAYGVSFNAENIAQEMKKNEIASEFSDVICAIERGTPFP